jgi:IclR family transcriptional regulator, KDG regulon repressor
MDSRGFVIAAVRISGPAGRFRKSVLPAWADAVKATKAEISDALGGGAQHTGLARLGFGAAGPDLH